LANVAGGIAGIGEDVIDRPIDRITPEEYHQTVRLNLDSAFFMTRALVPHFRSQHYGKVVNVADALAESDERDEIVVGDPAVGE